MENGVYETTQLINESKGGQAMDDGTKKMICIKDDTELKGIAEGQTRAEAIKKAKVFLKRQEEKQRAASKS
ncbi:hypothetical protein [Bacillus mycoides]|uniref:hypothetical protein n=1 Tax=Bacillus mycoides TaxID=1405 RepID=UPI001C32B1D0|nr:hypothetical protein [Bacillus mycoides]QWH53871.1 hypothetical protein EXW44_14045 [Bacillus mycoides]